MQSDIIALVATAIRQHPLCLQCIATTALSGETDADAALTKIGTAIQLRRDERERCQGCGEIRSVVSISMEPTG